MVQVVQAKNLTLAQLIEQFELQRSDDAQFFKEWREDLPELSDTEKQVLDDVKASYLHLSDYPLLEPLVKMVVLSPLLRLAGFYKPPFYLAAEKEVELVSTDEDTIVRGRIDILVFQPELWILAIEAKQTQYSLEAGIPQALAYMLAQSNSEKPGFGFITNGIDFIFLKLVRQARPTYGLSYPFSLRRGDDLYTVASILKHLVQLVSQS